MKRCGALFIVLSLLSACGGPGSRNDPNALDRSDAAILVQAKMNEQMPDNGCYALRSGGWQEGVDQGYWTEWWVTETGQPLVAEVTQGRVCLKSRVNQTLEITGIADGGMPGYKSIEFKLSNDPVPDPMRRFIIAGYDGVATARKYDDGWRIEGKIIYQRNDMPLPLTASQQQHANSDQGTEADRRQEADRFEAERQAKFNALVEESRKQTQPNQTFHCDTVIGDRRNTVDVSVNDVQVVRVGKTFDRIGNGGNTGTSTYPYGHIPSLKVEGEWLMFEQQNAGRGTHFMYFYPKQCPNYAAVETVIRKNRDGWWKRFEAVGTEQ